MPAIITSRAQLSQIGSFSLAPVFLIQALHHRAVRSGLTQHDSGL